MNCNHDHFEGKSVQEHLSYAKQKGERESSSYHAVEAPGHWISFFDSMRDSAIFFGLMGLVFFRIPSVWSYRLLICTASGWLVWKGIRATLINYSRLQKLHRVLEEEKHEITMNREQEKEELKELYAQKGLKGKLLDDVVEVLMADDNRLLHVMLEEELNLPLETLDHPLKQGVFAACAVFLVAVGYVLLYPFNVYVCAAYLLLSVGLSSFLLAKLHRLNLLEHTTWGISSFLLIILVTYFFMGMML